MKKEMYEIQCDPSCGFMMRSHNKEELMNLTKQHTDMMHPEMKVTDEQIKSMVKMV